MVQVISDSTEDIIINRFYGIIDALVDEEGGGTKDDDDGDNKKKKACVAFDVEGVNLSRVGTVELVSLAFDNVDGIITDGEESVFLVDFGKSASGGTNATDKRKRRIEMVKKLLQCGHVEKIIHDCRMDCDALFHLHGIALKNVHDTSCFHHVITGTEDANLNEVLSSNGIGENDARDKSIYKRNPEFWAGRPLTKTMIDWASSDVDKLIVLASRQKNETSSTRLAKAQSLSRQNVSTVTDMKIERGLTLRGGVHPGRFIGPRGSNIRGLQRRTGTMIYSDYGKGNNTWMVFYPNSSSLDSVKRSMGYRV
jgi:DNA polymerase I-like protein with 3'-5' exonuclease and polymerase domains